MTLSGKTLRKEKDRIRVLKQTNVIGRIRKELGVSTPPLRTSSWKSRAIPC